VSCTTEAANGFSFDADTAIAELRKRDPVLKELIAKVGAFHLKPVVSQSPFEALAESIVYQQLTGKAAATILRRVKELFREEGFFTPEDILAAPEKRLRSAGLSGAKTLALKDLALKSTQGYIPPVDQLLELSDDEIIERLVAIRGIGRWTVQMMLIFRFGKADVLPVDDYGVRKAFALVYGWPALPKPKELEAAGDVWRPYRTVASWYLWRATELPAATAAACSKKSKR
jgi:3-methyladenine DNA glycosylase/8-oxoguanine DNA glycosylase